MVTDDIVTRLRNPADLTIVMWEAADEIERLRADRDRWKALGQHVCEFHYNIIPDHIHDLFNDYNEAVRGD